MDNSKEVERILEANIQKEKKSLEMAFDKNFDTQEKTLTLIVKSIEHSRFNNFKESELIWNLAGYINLVSYDFKIIVRDLTFSNKEWQKRLYARQAFLLIYESMDDILELFGKKLRTTIKSFKHYDNLNQELQHNISKLNSFKSEHEQIIKSIRHNTIAHRDHDVLNQLKTILAIKWIESITLFKKYDDILNNLGALSQKLINESNDELARST